MPEKEGGTVLITVAISLMLLMGVAALAIDGGMAYNERRFTQAAADNAALTGAWAECQTPGSGEGAAKDSAALNGFTENVTPEVVDGVVSVTIGSDVQASFGRTQGTHEISVVSEAAARCEKVSGGSPYVLFAGAPPSCSDGLMIPASAKTVNGGMHTNGSMNISGPTETMFFNGHATYVSAMPHWMEQQYGSRFLAGHSQTTQQPYPVPEDWVIDNYDIDKNGAKAIAAQAEGKYRKWPSGMNTASGNLSSGLHFVKGDVNIYPGGGSHGSGNTLNSVTIVATGTMTISGSFNSASPYESDGLLLFGNSGGTATCWNNGLQMSASLNGFEGTIYFPNGKIGINNDQMIGNGAIIGYTVNLASSNFVISPHDGSGGESQYKVELIR